MPLTLTLTEGVLPKGQEKLAFARLTQAMLEWHGLAGNKTITANLVGTIHLMPLSATFTGMHETPVVFIEWKTPAFAFASREVQVGYFEEATNIIHEMSGGKQPKDNIYINVVHTVDGAWNWGGKSLSNAQIGEAIANG